MGCLPFLWFSWVLSFSLPSPKQRPHKPQIPCQSYSPLSSNPSLLSSFFFHISFQKILLSFSRQLSSSILLNTPTNPSLLIPSCDSFVFLKTVFFSFFSSNKAHLPYPLAHILVFAFSTLSLAQFLTQRHQSLSRYFVVFIRLLFKECI